MPSADSELLDQPRMPDGPTKNPALYHIAKALHLGFSLAKVHPSCIALQVSTKILPISYSKKEQHCPRERRMVEREFGKP